MARFAFKGTEEYALKLSKLGESMDSTARKAVHKAAGVVADQIRQNIETLPADQFRYLKEGETFKGVPVEVKQDLQDSLGIAKIDVDNKGVYNTKIGFDGYGSHPTRKYTRGVPNQLLARAIESGSSVRIKTPFVRPAINKTKKKAQEVMQNVIDDETKRIMK